MALKFTGPFAPMCMKFVCEKRALGVDYGQQEKLLHMFDNFSKAYPVENFRISEQLATDWSQKRPNETDSSRYNRVMEMRRFAEYLSVQGYTSCLVIPKPTRVSSHAPYIFTKEEIRKIFHVIDHLEINLSVPNRHIVMPVLFRVLYCCGLRVSEALALKLSDIDLQNGTVHIRHGKNGRERIVPMSESLTIRCQMYSQRILFDKSEDNYFFFGRLGEPYSRSGIGKAFRGFLWDAGIPYLGKDRGPNVHDLRHTFVCHRLNQWAKDGTDLNAVLPVLSKYLGHTSIAATAWYLKLTAEVYPDIIQTMDRFSAGVFPESWEVDRDE